MRSPVKLGFIGCGGHAARHAEVVVQMPDLFEIVSVCDTNWDTADAFKRRFGRTAHAITDSAQLFARADIDAVIISTPHKFHMALCQEAIAARKHILCEKPLWEGDHEVSGITMLAVARTKGLVFSSCHLRRFEQEFVYVKDHLANFVGRFGKALELRFQFFYHKPSTAWKMSDSLLLDHMNHEIDLVHFLFGHAPAQFWRLSNSFDEYAVAGKRDDGLAIWFSGSRRLNTRVFRNELEIVFETGRVRVEVVLDSLTGYVASRLETRSFENGKQEIGTFRPHSYNDSLRGVMENFARAIRGEDECYLTPRDLLINTAICNRLVADEHGSI